MTKQPPAVKTKVRTAGGFCVPLQKCRRDFVGGFSSGIRQRLCGIPARYDAALGGWQVNVPLCGWRNPIPVKTEAREPLITGFPVRNMGRVLPGIGQRGKDGREQNGNILLKNTPFLRFPCVYVHRVIYCPYSKYSGPSVSSG